MLDGLDITFSQSQPLTVPTTLMHASTIDTQHTLSRLQHWEQRLAHELAILQQDIESSEAEHVRCVAPKHDARRSNLA